jgi:hypothetical protein
MLTKNNKNEAGKTPLWLILWGIGEIAPIFLDIVFQIVELQSDSNRVASQLNVFTSDRWLLCSTQMEKTVEISEICHATRILRYEPLRR